MAGPSARQLAPPDAVFEVVPDPDFDCMANLAAGAVIMHQAGTDVEPILELEFCQKLAL